MAHVKLSKEQLESQTLIKSRERLFGRLQTTFDLIGRLPAESDIFRVRAAKSVSDLEEFERVQGHLSRLNLLLPPESQVETDQVSRAYDDLYFKIQASASLIREPLDANVNRENAAAPVREQQGDFLRPKLPPIQIPKFKGDLDKFPSFRSLFDTLIHNSNLPAIQKFSFLKTSLEYPALHIIEHFDFTDENYPAAYDKLVERYTDARLVGTHILNRLLHFKPLSSGSVHNLPQFSNVFCVQYDSLTSLKIPNLADFIVFNLALNVLDPETKRLFEDKHSHIPFPSFKELSNFIDKQCKVASLVQTPQKPNSSSTYHSVKSKISKTHWNSSATSPSTKTFLAKAQLGSTTNFPRSNQAERSDSVLQCPVCQAGHKIYTCPEFLAMTTNNKREKIKTLQLCFACLGKHTRSNCASKFSCRTCKDRTHHTFLHLDKQPRQTSPENTSMQSNSMTTPTTPVDSTTNVLNCRTNQVCASPSPIMGLLGTARARIQTPAGDWLSCRMVIDPASESSFITEDLAQSLHLSRKHLSVDIIGVGNSRMSNHRGYVDCQVAPMHSLEPQLAVRAIVLHSISEQLPKVPLPHRLRDRFHHLTLADPDFDKPGRIDMLIGVQHYSDILGDETTHIRGSPAAINSIFGFLIFGKIHTSSPTPTVSSFFTHTPPIDELLRKFWEIEDLPSSHPINPQDEYCESFFRQTTRRDKDGRYEVSLPFRERGAPTNLGSTRGIALKRLFNLERKLVRNPSLRESYNENLQDYVSQNHMKLAPVASNYLMTHHAVIKDSTSTKVRVVFNASEKSDTSTSLNDLLCTGPKLQSDIADVLTKFRLHKVALTADITKMFRCIRLNESDAKFTHLLWRTDYTSTIHEWELTTLPFGLACSPYLAQRVIQQLVEDEGTSFPLASDTLTKNIYVDDIICSQPEIDSITRLYSQLQGLLTRGGFSLHKVSSNSSNVLEHVPMPIRESLVSFDETGYVKLLGLKWDPKADVFCYQVTTDPFVPTKRGILSQVARIFDVMGYLTPITFWIKHFIQRLWLIGVGWDDALPPEFANTWHTFHSQLDTPASLQIPRSIDIARTAEYTLVGFGDASEKGYGACIYLRVYISETQVFTYLLKAKSKVAPLKPLTIPRLELEGANLLTSLLISMNSLRSSLPSHTLFCFTDSQIVLAWLRTPPHQLKTYVANRVSRIIEITPASSWRHVEGINNPADVASRGLFPQALKTHNLWWEGPSFLRLPHTQWPIATVPKVDRIPELKTQTTSLMTSGETSGAPDHVLEILVNRFSCLLRIQRILAFVARFTCNLRVPQSKRRDGPLTLSELNDGLMILVRHTQNEYYARELRELKLGRPLKGFVRHLTPFVTDSGLLRVGGRLRYAPLNDAKKHPILIPRQSRLAVLLCTYFHKITLHGGPQLMQSLIQRKFWIPGIRSLLRNFVFKCLTCYRFKATPMEPFMSSIPSLRFQQLRAFVNTGVDLAGPYFVKESKRRNARKYKIWVVLFICMSTRAIHLDIVEDISTATFLGALDRFIARRGIPSKLFSDMGTNFVGAARELRNILETFEQEAEVLYKFCNEREITWEFNPSAAPHFGGSWESAIKRMKHHMRRVMGDLTLTLPEFSTFLIKIEAILNSRPLCPMSTNPSDGFDYLTPGHFLVGAPILLSRPEEDLSKGNISLHTRWALITRCVQDFWKRWAAEYIHTLMPRQKWTRKDSNISPGTLVLLIDSSLPANLWSLGRVMEALPGRDGVVRVVKLRTPTGIITRPLTKISPLPFLAEEIKPRPPDTPEVPGPSSIGIW